MSNQEDLYASYLARRFPELVYQAPSGSARHYRVRANRAGVSIAKWMLKHIITIVTTLIALPATVLAAFQLAEAMGIR